MHSNGNVWRTRGTPGFEHNVRRFMMALDVEGTLPEWLDGTFISDGPGQFEVGGTPEHRR